MKEVSQLNNNKNKQENKQKTESEQQQQNGQLSTLQLFKQQMLRAWQPIPTLTKTTILFFSMALVFLGLGIPMLILSTNIIQASVRYDNICTTYNKSTCLVNITVPKDMPGPVFVYYQLHNFYQNHRLYAQSLSTKQLLGNNLTASDIESDCSPIVYNKDLYVNVSITNASLDPNAPANPCGMIAYTLFNDTFNISGINITYDNIAWPGDAFKYNAKDPSVLWTNVSSPRFQNWMRIAALPNFRKLWGRIQEGILQGTYNITIINNYDISSFNGQKFFVLSTSNFFGSRNQFLSISYIVVGGLCLISGCLFLGKKIMKKLKKK